MKSPLPRAVALSGAAVLLTALTACGASDEADGVSVVTSFYPLEFIAGKVGGDNISVSNLTEAGAGSHDLELGADQVAEIVDSDLVLYLEGFQPAVDEAVTAQAPDKGMNVAESTTMLDDSHGHDHDDEDADHDHEHGDVDPHVWLDPTKTAEIADAVAERLSDVDPGHAEEYAGNARDLRDELSRLDESYAGGLAECDSRDLVTSHAAFGYLAERYDLHQIAVSGLSPETEPDAEALSEVSDYVKDNDVTTVFYETLVSPDVADTIASETGAETAVLDPLEGLAEDADGDYLSIMESNLDVLEGALRCR